MSKKRFALLDATTDYQRATAARLEVIESDWSACFICQEGEDDQLVCPAQKSNQVDKLSGYRSIDEIGELPGSVSKRISNLNCDQLIEKLVANEGKYHKKCKNKYDNQHYQRVCKKRKHAAVSLPECPPPPSTRARYSAENFCPTCFFCDQKDLDDNLTKAQTLGLDKRVRDAAVSLRDEKLLARLSEGDLIAVEAVYHKTCLAALYNRVRNLNGSTSGEESEQSIIEGVALAEVLEYIKSSYEGSSDIPVFMLRDIKSLFCQRLIHYGANEENVSKVHSSRLKQKILSHIPGLGEHKKGREVLLTFNEETGSAIHQLCSQSFEEDGICLSKAANILRKQVFEHQWQRDSGLLTTGSQEASVPKSLITFISMLIDGTNISQRTPATGQTALTISQLIRFNMMKDKRRNTAITEFARHSQDQETPFPLYTGLLIHSKTRKKDLVNTFARQGLSVSYSRVKSVELSVTKQLCKQYRENECICPPSLKEGIFTTSAIDNIDHNPSSTTAKDSFHGTSISISQHPETSLDVDDLELQPNIEVSNTKLELPDSYTTLPPTKAIASEYPLQSVNICENTHIDAEREASLWLSKVKSLDEESSSKDIENRISWSGFHSRLSEVKPVKTLSTLLPLLHDSINSTAMVRHTMDIVKQILLKINPDQCPVITADQPVYALGKQIQWMYPKLYGEDKLVMMMGALHIEMAFLNAIGDWMEGSGWVEVVSKAEINSPGRAEAFLSGSHVKRSRYVALHLLLLEAYEKSEGEHSFEAWVSQRRTESVQFDYWFTVMQLESILLLFIQAVRESNFQMFISALDQIAPWMFCLDHTHYSRWLPIYISDLKYLQAKHPAVYREFIRGHFTSKKTSRTFSAIAEDQAHEQNNKLIKIEGGAIGILDNHASLMKWMVGGPEIARVVSSFNNEEDKDQEDLFHHEDTDSHEKRFRKNVLSFKTAFDELGNPFEEGDILINVVSKHIMNESAATSVRVAYATGKKQYDEYLNDRLVTGKVSIYAPISKNKLPLFREKNTLTTTKAKLQIVSLKQDCKLFASLYVSCQSRDGDLDDFFAHENHVYPPSLSEYGRLRKCNKADFFKCLEVQAESEANGPPVTAKVVDGAALVQMTPPGDEKTFGDYAKSFAAKIMRELRGITLERIDIVFDRYFKDSLKSQTREKRGSGVRLSVRASTPISKNWRQFLRVDENKEELFCLLAKQLEMNGVSGKTIVATLSENVIFNGSIDEESLMPCNHEEADTRMFVHVKSAAAANHRKISIRTVDTDVVVIAIALFNSLTLEELWVEFGVAKNKRWLPVHAYSANMRNGVCSGLLFWFAFTGCDTVSSFCGRAKKIAWEAWKSYPDATNVFSR